MTHLFSCMQRDADSRCVIIDLPALFLKFTVNTLWRRRYPGIHYSPISRRVVPFTSSFSMYLTGSFHKNTVSL